MTAQPTGPGPGAPPGYAWREVGPAGELTFAPGHVVQYDDIKRRVALFDLTGGGYAAIDDICPHAGASLGDGWREGEAVACPLHGWEFDLRTGTCPYGEAWSTETFATRVVDGILEVFVGPRVPRR